MKAIGLPPSDSRVRQMNDAQWLWCYFNLQEDEREDEEAWKNRLDYLTWFINPEMAKSVHEHENRAKKKDSRPIGSSEFRADEAVYQNNEFELEAKAASLGYDPDSGLSPREFLKQYDENQNSKEIDIMNDDFDDLLASGQFTEVADFSSGAGDPTETFDDFLSRVQHFEGSSQEEWDILEKMKFAQENIGIETLDDLSNEQQVSNEDYDRQKFLEALERQGLTEDDLDIFEIHNGDDE